MPSPDLKCHECGVTFQRIPVGWNRALTSVCPNCGSSDIDLRIEPTTVWHSAPMSRQFVRGTATTDAEKKAS